MNVVHDDCRLFADVFNKTSFSFKLNDLFCCLWVKRVIFLDAKTPYSFFLPSPILNIQLDYTYCTMSSCIWMNMFQFLLYWDNFFYIWATTVFQLNELWVQYQKWFQNNNFRKFTQFCVHIECNIRKTFISNQIKNCCCW